MSTKNVTHQYRLSQWAPIIKECKNSGLTVLDWCVENNINEKRFYYWQRKVREELASSLISTNNSSNETTTFVPMLKQDSIPTEMRSSFTPDMILDIGKYRLEISNTINPQVLSEIIKVIHHV